jgi:hypothetical protein
LVEVLVKAVWHFLISFAGAKCLVWYIWGHPRKCFDNNRRRSCVYKCLILCSIFQNGGYEHSLYMSRRNRVVPGYVCSLSLILTKWFLSWWILFALISLGGVMRPVVLRESHLAHLHHSCTEWQNHVLEVPLVIYSIIFVWRCYIFFQQCMLNIQNELLPFHIFSECMNNQIAVVTFSKNGV